MMTLKIQYKHLMNEALNSHQNPKLV